MDSHNYEYDEEIYETEYYRDDEEYDLWHQDYQDRVNDFNSRTTREIG